LKPVSLKAFRAKQITAGIFPLCTSASCMLYNLKAKMAEQLWSALNPSMAEQNQRTTISDLFRLHIEFA
jgi:hypothetical protein